ncbi:conserved exported hypothetical protein [Candidatus Nitrotoga sp. HW29]|uniref:hypothetical protein n=1 Tax=Candidatus Nitrotoga sp. HW29 TaxID=2886963 RepID=UPI001EF1BBA8|nr:hypothetical protein [Candidatus Nitrotoga sp. HW29]CAH1906472.1 conserved exported hypothetical protein [Candidatus Nitrotoga sp. HW29]
MNKVIVNFAIVSCFALGATLVHADNGKAGKSVNYYEAYDPHGVVQTGPGGAQGVMHPKHPIQMESDDGVASPNASTPPVKDMTHPGHRKVDGA